MTQADVPYLLENIWYDSVSIMKAIDVANEEEVVQVLTEIMAIYEKFYDGHKKMKQNYNFDGKKMIIYIFVLTIFRMV